MIKECSTEKCKNKTTRGSKCSSCKSRAYREKYPMRSAFYNLRSNAKRRNKDFSLTFEQFIRFCNRTDYIRKKGRSSTSYTIDRRCESQGYHLWNIQVLENGENIKKYLRYYWDEKDRKMVFFHETLRTNTDKGDSPF